MRVYLYVQVDIVFLVDCTGSMRSYIESVKNNVKGMYDEIRAKFTNADLRFSFVRYTDYDQPESTRTTWVDFTTSVLICILRCLEAVSYPVFDVSFNERFFCADQHHSFVTLLTELRRLVAVIFQRM